MLKKINLYFHTLKHLKIEQTFGRIFAVIKRKLKLYRLPPIPDKLSGTLLCKVAFIEKDSWNSREGIIKGEFNFGYEKNNLGFPPKWHLVEMAPLCRLHINFFNYLYLLNKTEKIILCQSWIKNNPIKDNLAWKPYGLSLRIFSWMRANLKDETIDRSIYNPIEEVEYFRN